MPFTSFVLNLSFICAAMPHASFEKFRPFSSEKAFCPITAQLNLGLCAWLLTISLFRNVKNNILKSMEIKQGNNFSEMTTKK